MYKQRPEKDKLFRQVLKGEQAALMDILEGERHELFDYLMRMTGQVTRSYESVDEVFSSLTRETIATLGSYGELKVCIFATARRFNADIWNADISILVNAAVSPDKARNVDVIEVAVANPKAALKADEAFRALGGQQREAVLLSMITGFELAEISEITDQPIREVEQLISQGLVLLKQELGASADVVQFMREHLVLHPQPVRSSAMTLNLSQLMQGIRAKPVGIWSPLRLALVGVVLALLVVWLVFPTAFSRAVDVWRPVAAPGDK